MKTFTTADYSAIADDQFAEDVRFFIVAEGAHDKEYWLTFSRRAEEALAKLRIQHDTLTMAAYKVAGVEDSFFVDDEEALKDSVLLPDILALNAKITSAEYQVRVLQEAGYNQGHIKDTREADARRFSAAEWADDQGKQL